MKTSSKGALIKALKSRVCVYLTNVYGVENGDNPQHTEVCVNFAATAQALDQHQSFYLFGDTIVGCYTDSGSLSQLSRLVSLNTKAHFPIKLESQLTPDQKTPDQKNPVASTLLLTTARPCAERSTPSKSCR